MNSVTLIGRLTKDPIVSYSASTQNAVARFSIAIDRMPDKNGNKATDYPSIVCFGKTAELVEKYMTKGRLVGITGRLQTGSYEKNGQKIYTTDVVADRVEFLDKAGSSEGGFNPQSSSEGRDDRSQSGNTAPKGFNVMTDDDIPF